MMVWCSQGTTKSACFISYQCSGFIMVWCSPGTTEGGGNHQLSVLKFHDGMVLTGHHTGGRQSSVIGARVS